MVEQQMPPNFETPVPPNQGRIDQMSTALELVEEMCHFCTEVGGQFRWAENKSVHQQFVRFTEIFQSFMGLVSDNRDISPLLDAPNSDFSSDESLVACIRELLGDLIECYSKKDYVLLADILQFDLFTVLIVIRDRLAKEVP